MAARWSLLTSRRYERACSHTHLSGGTFSLFLSNSHTHTDLRLRTTRQHSAAHADASRVHHVRLPAEAAARQPRRACAEHQPCAECRCATARIMYACTISYLLFHSHTCIHTRTQLLGLNTCADSILGDELVRGVSGGELKRTNVSVEIVSSPRFLFVDGEHMCMHECVYASV